MPKINIKILLIATFLIFIAIEFVFIYKNKIKDINNGKITTKTYIKKEEETQKKQTNLETTYESTEKITNTDISKISSKDKNAPGSWNIITKSLKKYDINNDGQLDIVGLETKKDKNGTYWRFTTWFKNGNKYSFYNYGYNDLFFSLTQNQNENFDVPCEIIDLATKKVTLNCKKGGGSSKTILHYQPNGIGYFIDPEDSLYKFTKKQNLKKFVSKSAGIEFGYPKNLNVEENAYNINNDNINIIKIKNNNKLVLLIYVFSTDYTDTSGGMIDASEDVIFLKNLEGRYFVRNKYFGDSENFNYVYHQLEPKKKNKDGDIFNTYNETFTTFGKGYYFLAFADENKINQINQIDNIIASTKFFKPLNTAIYKKTETKPNKKFQLRNVSWKLPGIITKHKSDTFLKEKAIAFEDLDIKLIDSDFFRPSHITIKLLPYQSIKFYNIYNNEGFDAQKNKCYYEEYDDNKKYTIYKKPETVGKNRICSSYMGDAGFFAETHYVIDPNKKYILSISQTNDGQWFDINNLITLDLNEIIKTVEFGKK